jgi:hypothetical protein
MKKLFISLASLSFLFLLTNCRKNDEVSKKLSFSMPTLNRDMTIVRGQTKTFQTEAEFKEFIENGLKNLQFKKLPALRQKRIRKNGGIRIDYDDSNPCANNSANGETGVHMLNESVVTSDMFTAVTGLSLGISIGHFYESDGSNISVTGGMAVLTGTSSSQQSFGTTAVNGTTISSAGIINATWSAGYSNTMTSSTNVSSGGSGGFTVTAGPFSVNGSGGGTHSTTVTSTQTNSGTVNLTAQFAYELSEDICSGHGNITVKMNGTTLCNINF